MYLYAKFWDIVESQSQTTPDNASNHIFIYISYNILFVLQFIVFVDWFL